MLLSSTTDLLLFQSRCCLCREPGDYVSSELGFVNCAIVSEQFVNVLEGQVCGLWYEEEREDSSQEAKTGKEYVCSKTNAFNHGRDSDT